MLTLHSARVVLLVVVSLMAPALAIGETAQAAVAPDVVQATITRLVSRFGDAQADRIRLGVAQVAAHWWPDDGDAAAFSRFCEERFIADPAVLAATFARLEQAMEQVDGHLAEIRRELRTPLDLDTGPILAVDSMLSDLDLAAHEMPDLYGAKVAQLVLLNFPVHSLAERLRSGASWDRETWARSRMAEAFSHRVPAAVSQEVTRAGNAADAYIAEYNIRMDRIVTPEGTRLFPDGLRLISHWGLRDELASHYGEKDGLAKQRAIQRIMERIVRQEIPAVVIDNPEVLWCPETNEVRPFPPGLRTRADLGAREPDARYERLLASFRAMRQIDPYEPMVEEASPGTAGPRLVPSTAIRRVFELDRQIPEPQVVELLTSVLTSAEVRDAAKLISRRLGRPLEPFDIWYSGFNSRRAHSEEELDRVVAARYPTVAAFQADLPRILTTLGFSSERARWLADRIVVDPSRGAGHALGAARREDKAHLRTRIPAGGMNYKGYNIAIHELGHNVEQSFSLGAIDHWSLAGVPNNAFTEALAFSFQKRDLELLGLGAEGAAARGTDALGTLWATYEIGGVALVDLAVWHWMYDHPLSNAAELREATLAAAREVWNRYYAPVFGVRDVEILAIYSHMIAYPLYLADYPIGHIIDFQVGEKLQGPAFGAEFERMARQGRLTPDAWMRGAVGEPLSSRALLAAARTALNEAK